MKLKKPLGTKMTDGTTRYMAKEVAYMLGIKPSALSTYVHNKIIEGLLIISALFYIEVKKQMLYNVNVIFWIVVLNIDNFCLCYLIYYL